MIVVCLIIIIFLLIYCVYHRHRVYPILEKFNNISVYKCPSLGLGKLYTNVYKKNNISRIDHPEWSDIYVPCGYNNVENELKSLRVYNETQKIYGINGCDNIVSKNGLWKLVENYYGRRQASLLLPETYILNEPQDLELFKKLFNPNTIYLLKKNIQRKLGIELTSNLDTILSKQNSSFKVVQKYVPDLYLIQKRKVNLRLYLLITCHNGKFNAYLHKLGKCIYTNKDFDTKDSNIDKECHLTSLNLNQKVYETRPETLNDLKEYIGKRDFDILMNNITYNLRLIIKAVSGYLCRLVKLKKNLCFQLFGLDYIFNERMTPYLLEMNKGPEMGVKSPNDMEMKENVLDDVLKVINIVNSNHQFIKL